MSNDTNTQEAVNQAAAAATAAVTQAAKPICWTCAAKSVAIACVGGIAGASMYALATSKNSKPVSTPVQGPVIL